MEEFCSAFGHGCHSHDLARIVAKVTKPGLVNFFTQSPHFKILFTHQATLKCLLILEIFGFSCPKRCKWTQFHSRVSLLAKPHLAFHHPSWMSQFKQNCSILIWDPHPHPSSLWAQRCIQFIPGTFRTKPRVLHTNVSKWLKQDGIGIQNSQWNENANTWH